MPQADVGEVTDGVKIINVTDAISLSTPVTILIRPSQEMKRTEYHSRNTLLFQWIY